MKKVFLIICLSILPFVLYADDLAFFAEYAHKADSAFSHGDKALSFQTNRNLIEHYNTSRKKFEKNKEISKIVFEAYCSLAILDKSQTDKEISELLVNGLSLIDKPSGWVDDYKNKSLVINCFVNLIGSLAHIGDSISACQYNQKMISFAEQYFKYEIASVLLTACDMYSILHMFDENYPLYKRLYEMFDDLDRLQQYEVVKNLIRFEFQRENYSTVVELSLKHEKLIANSKDEVKDVILDLIGLGHLRYARQINGKYGNAYMNITDQVYDSGCAWALRNNVLIFPTICIGYAYWLYGFKEQIPKALAQYELYLDCIEHCKQDKLFDSRYRIIEDAENALISILVQRIKIPPIPADLNGIIKKYPKVIAEIRNNLNSEFYEDFNYILKQVQEKCYGK